MAPQEEPTEERLNLAEVQPPPPHLVLPQEGEGAEVPPLQNPNLLALLLVAAHVSGKNKKISLCRWH